MNRLLTSMIVKMLAKNSHVAVGSSTDVINRFCTETFEFEKVVFYWRSSREVDHKLEMKRLRMFQRRLCTGIIDIVYEGKIPAEYLEELRKASWGKDYSTAEYFECKVDLIINCDVSYECEYMECLGWYRDVSTAITLVGGMHLDMLLGFQKNHGIVFERMVMGYIEMKKKNSKFKVIKHYAFNVIDEDSKKSGDVGTCVVFVKCDTLVLNLVDEMKLFVCKEE